MTTEEYAQAAARKYLLAWERQSGAVYGSGCGITYSANMLGKAVNALGLTMPGEDTDWWGARYLVLATDLIGNRGKSGGLCATPDCPHMSRWIPVSHVSTKPQPFEYYCAPCCDRIAEQRVS